MTARLARESGAHLLSLSLAVVSAATLAGTLAAHAAPTTVIPGGLARWDAPGVTGCRMDGQTFPPVLTACLYPIDLGHAEGTVRVGRLRDGVWEEGELRVAPSPYKVERITLPDDTHLKLSKANLERSKRDAARAGAAFGLRTPARFALPLAPALEGQANGAGRNFGTRRFFNGEARNPHSGVDYPVPTGTFVHALERGRVVIAEDQFFPGRAVFVDHGGGLITMYFHLSALKVTEGQEIARGDVVGVSGQSGRVSGPHLHLAARLRGAKIDPRTLLQEPALLQEPTRLPSS